MLVLKGNFESAEKFLEDSSESQLFHKFIMEQDYKGVWSQIMVDLELEPMEELRIPYKPR